MTLSEMNRRERILAAINHQPVDRIPTDIWATAEVWEMLQRHFGTDQQGAIDALGIDYIAMPSPAYIGPPMQVENPYPTLGVWRIPMRRIEYATGSYDEFCNPPLANLTTLDDLKDFPWPNPDWFDYAGMVEQVRALHEKHAVRAGYMAPFFFHNLTRGLEASLMDPYRDPEYTHYLVGRITDYFLEYHRRLFEACDGLLDMTEVTDDLGCQSGPMISLEVFREFYKPHMKRLIDLSKEFGLKVFHHDDGGCRPFIPELVEMGIDILNPVQHNCPGMDRTELKAEFGKQVCFHGAIENQQILPFGTPEDVRAEVRTCIDTLATDRTGYILAPCHNLQPVTPIENILAMYDEARRYGQF